MAAREWVEVDREVINRYKKRGESVDVGALSYKEFEALIDGRAIPKQKPDPSPIEPSHLPSPLGLIRRLLPGNSRSS